MRYERKYRIEQASFQEVLHTVKMNPAAFRTAFPDRWVNSVYICLLYTSPSPRD